ncbi:MAG: hypothetical protein JJT81_12715 [Rubellimicrobium sp.]|nr:hypothetical protein [Rubellimicrobium sp.]
MLAGVHQVSEFEPTRTQLFGDLAPGFPGMGPVGPVEGLSDRGGDDGVLAARECAIEAPLMEWMADKSSFSARSVVEVTKLHLDHTPRWSPGITPPTAVQLHQLHER